MLDVRPVDKNGNLDTRRIKLLLKKELAEKPKLAKRKITFRYEESKQPVPLIKFSQPKINFSQPKNQPAYPIFENQKKFTLQPFKKLPLTTKSLTKKVPKKDKIKIPSSSQKSFRRKFFSDLQKKFREVLASINYKKIALSLAGIPLAFLLSFYGFNFYQKASLSKNSVSQKGERAFLSLVQAKDNLENKNLTQASSDFQEAYLEFNKISKEIEELGGSLTQATRFLPYFSKISTGSHLAQAGEDISQAGIIALSLIESTSQPDGSFSEKQNPDSFLEILRASQEKSEQVVKLLESAQKNLEKVNLKDLPENYQKKFLELREKLPEALVLASSLKNNGDIFYEILGGNGPRKYLFLFQNNQEMRATGGFIGSYGILDIFNGRVRKFFIDGIFNPDGQLKEKIIPPAPLQKISAAWSLHDSNWFPDFPVSAEKAIWFYEKTGGPTVDGVITMTPSIMQKLLEITGPIEMPEYEVTIDKDNFIEKIQQEVEIDYDKELNQPKKILADLAPQILDRLFNDHSLTQINKLIEVLNESLKERQILVYSRNHEIEKKISAMGWSGEILDTDKDYLSVINSNINGYKTDGVIEQTIEHQTEIQADGSLQNTVTITRQHKGGNSEYDWWNKVNSDYLRVYVPRGSSLISVEGQTREFNSSPLDYKLLGFKNDSQIRQEEDFMKIDEESGTRIYEDANKTVFANWVYVSPQETTTLKYTYLLPFKINLNLLSQSPQSYSLLFQKQAGSSEENFFWKIIYPDSFSLIWRYPNEIEQSVPENTLKLQERVKTDKFIGVTFLRK